MLGSILRILIFGGAVAALAWGATYLIENPGGIVITWGGLEYPPISAIEFVVAILVLCLALVLLFKLTGLVLAFLRFLAGDDNAISRFFDRSRERRGLEALAAGMQAIAAGDAATARTRAERAERLLARPDLTRLLNAQAAQATGDGERARTYWRALASEPETQYTGIRGLLMQALEAGEEVRALKIARRAFEIRQDDPEVLDTLYRLQLAQKDWDGARRTTTAQRRAAMIDKAELQRREGAITLMEAREAERLGETDHARKLAIEAAKRDPASTEAAVAAARHLTASGSLRIAARLIVDAWRLAPDPRLATAYAGIEPEETPAARRTRFAALIEANPGHPESRLLGAELALAEGDWKGARRFMDRVGEDDLTPRGCAIMAALTRGEGRPVAEVRTWLARALDGGSTERIGGAIGTAELLRPIVGEERGLVRHTPVDAAERQPVA